MAHSIHSACFFCVTFCSDSSFFFFAFTLHLDLHKINENLIKQFPTCCYCDGVVVVVVIGGGGAAALISDIIRFVSTVGGGSEMVYTYIYVYGIIFSTFCACYISSTF